MDTHHGMHMFINRGSQIIVGAQILLSGLPYSGSQLLLACIALHPLPPPPPHRSGNISVFSCCFIVLSSPFID
jgi:hypothetical protein